MVGIDDYPFSQLRGCVNDAKAMRKVLKRHEKGDPNFDCFSLMSSEREVTQALLRTRIEDLFKGESELALLYFSGHGHLNKVGGFLVTQDAKEGNIGIAMDEIVTMANQSKSKEVIIILDCCHAGAVGNHATTVNRISELKQGLTVLAASDQDGHARERMGAGLFTSILINGLKGQAADIFGHVSAGGLYNLAASLFSAWEQSPIFKCHVSGITPLRYCSPKVEKELLRELPNHFKDRDKGIPLSPANEQTSPMADANQVSFFKRLGQLERQGIIKCRDYPTMYETAMNSGDCILTEFGKFIWELAKKERI